MAKKPSIKGKGADIPTSPKHYIDSNKSDVDAMVVL